MISKVENRLRKVCRNYEQVENYEKAIADEEQIWDLHHRIEIDENKSAKQLQEEGRYYDVDPSELIFLTISEHRKLHHKGKHYSEESRKKMSKAQSNRSEETRKKMSEALKGENHPSYGKHWFNNGIDEIKVKECPEGFTKGRLKYKRNANKKLLV